MAKKVAAAKVSKRAGKRRGGRRRGEWQIVEDGALADFRKTQRISRGKVAELLGVSQTTIQNWETGKAVPTKKSQTQLAELLKLKGGATADASVAAPRGASRPASSGNGASTAAQLTATSEIVKGFLATPTGGKVSADALVALTKALRAALA